jgi:hypothetical protein
VVGFGHHPSCLLTTEGRPAVWLRLAALAVVCHAAIASAAGEPAPPVPKPMTIIEAGTVVDDPGRDRWNRIVLLATPRFASGDTDDVSESIREAVSGFTFAILATVRPVDASAAEKDAPRYDLVEVGVGYSMRVNDRLTVIAPDAALPGFSLDFLSRQVLNAKHKSLGDIECVGRHATAVAFDAPTLMLRGDDHEDLVVRHLVRLDPQSGLCSTCAWLVTADDDDASTPLEEPLRIVDGGTREERSIHVDGRRFTFGLPTKRAFAVEDLPPGRRVDWSASLRTAADVPTYTEKALSRLTTELDAAIASLRTLRSAER